MSGGIDSFACAHVLQVKDFQIEGMFFNYGQAARRFEERAARRLCKFLGIGLEIQRLLVGNTFGQGLLVGRNALFVFAALMVLDYTRGIIAIGIHRGTPYYDCSKSFFEKVRTIVEEYTDGRIQLIAPFLEWNKGDIVKYCKIHRLPLAYTYSCEKGRVTPCGKCLSCLDRQRLEC